MSSYDRDNKQKAPTTMAKTFKGYVPKVAPTFDIEGADGTSLTVVCRPAVAGSTFLDFLGGADQEDYAAMAVVTKQVINACIPDSEEFWEFVGDPNKGIDITMLAQISGYLSELYSGDRPLEPSQPSSAT